MRHFRRVGFPFFRVWVVVALMAPSLTGFAALKWDRTEARIEMKPDQEEARATFTVTNESHERLRIARVKTSCGCTGTILKRPILEPGESTEIVGTFNKGKRRGLNHNKLEVYLDNRAEPVATLHMIVEIPELVTVQPAIIYWNPSSSRTERTVRIQLDERYVDEIDSVVYDPAKLSVIDEAKPKNGADRILKIKPKRFDQMVREAVEIHATGPDGRKAEGKLMVFVQP